MPTLRRLTALDYDDVVDLWIRSGLDSVRPAGRDSREAFARQLEGGQIVVGLEVEGRLAGAIVATHDTRKGWLNRLAVDPAHRRKGYATLLHRAAEHELRKLGLRIFAALVESENASSLALLRKEGYLVSESILYLTRRDSTDV